MIDDVPASFLRPIFRLLLAIQMLGCIVRYQGWIIYKRAKLGNERDHLLRVRARKKPAIDTDCAWNMLRQTQELAHACGARPFLVSGTLLGIHRNGRLLPHDNDMDIGLHADDPGLPAFVDALKRWEYTRAWRTVRLSSYDRLLNPWLPAIPGNVIIHKFDVAETEAGPIIRIDIFVHFNAMGYVVHGTNRTLWLNSPFALEEALIEGTRFHLPADRRKYLTENYGDFETPRTNFDSFVDCPNGVNIYSFSATRPIAAKWSFFKRTHDAPRGALIRQRIMDFFGYCAGRRPDWKIRAGDV